MSVPVETMWLIHRLFDGCPFCLSSSTNLVNKLAPVLSFVARIISKNDWQLSVYKTEADYMSLVMRKPVFVVSKTGLLSYRSKLKS